MAEKCSDPTQKHLHSKEIAVGYAARGTLLSLFRRMPVNTNRVRRVSGWLSAIGEKPRAEERASSFQNRQEKSSVEHEELMSTPEPCKT